MRLSSKLQENKHTDHIPLDIIDQVLKNSQSLCKPKWHDQVLIMTTVSVESCFTIAALHNADQTVCVAYVQFGKNHEGV